MTVLQGIAHYSVVPVVSLNVSAPRPTIDVLLRVWTIVYILHITVPQRQMDQYKLSREEVVKCVRQNNME